MSELTFEQKLRIIEKHCHNREDECHRCVLHATEESCTCPSVVDRNYAILVANGDVEEPVGNLTPTELSKVDHPSHYNQGDIECIDAMESAFGKEAVKHFCICNAFKYIWRAEKKNGAEDIDKTIWYLNKYKELSDVHE